MTINTAYPGTTYWSTATTINPYIPYMEPIYMRRLVEDKVQEATEELDNLLDDYLEELRASDGKTIQIKDVINALQTMQKKVEDKLRGSLPDIDSDFVHVEFDTEAEPAAIPW